jgi:hypothetical protein
MSSYNLRALSISLRYRCHLTTAKETETLKYPTLTYPRSYPFPHALIPGLRRGLGSKFDSGYKVYSFGKCTLKIVLIFNVDLDTAMFVNNR